MAMNQISLPLSSRVPTELYARLRAQSEHDGVPIARHVRQALEAYLEELGTPPLHPLSPQIGSSPHPHPLPIAGPLGQKQSPL